MTIKSIPFALILLITACATNNSQSEKQISKIISPEEFQKKMQADGAQVIDVRTIEEIRQGAIKGAKQIDFFKLNFEDELNKLDKKKPIMVYCRSGNRSGKAAEKLEELGFSMIYNLEGGYEAWHLD